MCGDWSDGLKGPEHEEDRELCGLKPGEERIIALSQYTQVA